MIPAIGYMIAFYIITRMFSLILKKEATKESVITIVFAGITILVAIYGIYALFTSEISLSSLNLIP